MYFDDVEVVTADRVPNPTTPAPPRICTHNITIEAYEPVPDDTFEAAIEAELDARWIEWTKQDRYWLKDLQRYQTVYEFSYTIKE